MHFSRTPITRRRFLGLAGRTLAVSIVGLAAGGTYACTVEPTWLEVNRHRVVLPRLPPAFAGIRIAHLTDLHHSELLGKKYLEEVFETVMRERPDMIAITGDFITGFRGDFADHRRRNGDFFLAEICEMLKVLRAPLGVWASLGNHDFWYGAQQVTQFLFERAGVRVLRDENVRIVIEDSQIALVGLTDLWSETIAWDRALSGVGESDCRIAMMHNPDAFDAACAAGLDLVMCGHTHGGQVRIPILGPPILPIKQRRFAEGWFHSGGTRMYVNRGVGVIALPVRFNARPEAAIFELQPEAEKAA
jgi:predicted MPP superfamily phosphohydrolase